MVQELLPLLPDALTTPQTIVCVGALVIGVFLWLTGSVWSRGIVSLIAVTLGGLLGLYLPRWQMWPINSMALAVLGAVGLGVSAYLVQRLWMGLTLGFVLACWAALATWMHQRPADFVWEERAAWQVQHLTPPERARDLYIRFPEQVRRVMPYAAGTAMLSGLALSLLFPRLGRALGMSVLGVTMIVVFGLVLLAEHRGSWLQFVPAQPVSQAGVLAGMVIMGLLAQWPFIASRVSKQAQATPPESSAAARVAAATDKQLKQIFA